jgi:hypothetical protein
MSDTEKIFADGFSFKYPSDKAPQFVIGKLSVKVEDAKAFLDKHQDNGWVNLEIKEAKNGKTYIELSTFKPRKDEGSAPY